MKTPFFHRLYVRLWLAVVVAVFVLTLLVGWLLRFQEERIRAERLAEVPAREVVLRNAQGEVIGSTSVKPVRVPGRGVEFHIQLPSGVQGGEQLAISLPPRPRPNGAVGQIGAHRPPLALLCCWRPLLAQWPWAAIPLCADSRNVWRACSVGWSVWVRAI
jgi:hypothetical protein